MEYADYHHAMAQHAAALTNSNQIHPAMAQIPMLSAAGLNLTVSAPNQVMSGGLANQTGNQHHLTQGQAGHHVMYQNIQATNTGTATGTNTGHHHQINQAGGHGHGHGHGSGGHGHGKKNKKPKVNKDGVPAPKRATTAYINFTQWYREELKKSGRPIPKIGDFGKECAGKWNAMNEEEKTPFLNVAAKDRERYKREMAIYKPARDANKPKRPGTAFMLFMGDFRKEMAGKEPEGGVAALAKLGGERWRNMTEEDKRQYVERQNEEKLRYEQNMEEYRRKSAGMTAGPPQKAARLSTEGSEGAGSAGDSDSGGHLDQGAGQISGGTQADPSQQASLVTRHPPQGTNTPSPATSSSSPQAQQTMSPSPLSTGTSSGQHQAQSINNASVNASSNNMSSLPPLSTPMSLSHAITNHASALAMAGYPQHTFAAANFGHPGAAAGVLAAGAAAAAAANYNQAHTTGAGSTGTTGSVTSAGGASGGNIQGNSSSYLPPGGSATNYGQSSHLSGTHYSWN